MPSATLEHDWVLSCGGWVVGRLHEQLRATGRDKVFAWSLTGPYVPPGTGVATRGDAATVADAKAQLVNAMRQWSIWAGVRQPDGGGPVDPQWVHADDGELKLITANFVVGKISQSVALGKPQPPHGRLLTSGPMQGPVTCAGSADSIDEAKAELASAWCAWLRWAELSAPAVPKRT